MTTVIFYRTLNYNIAKVDWFISNKLLQHIEKYSRFTWYNCNEHKSNSIVIKSFHYTTIDLYIDNKQSYIQRYKLCDAICRFLETLPPHKPLPVINESTHPEFYI